MKRLIALLLLVAAGCTNPGTLTKAHVGIVDGNRSIDLTSHKDTKIEKFRRVSPDGSSIELDGYSSVANQAAIEASTAQAKTLSDTLGATLQMFQMMGAMFVQMQTGGMVRPQVPAAPAPAPAPASAPAPTLFTPAATTVLPNCVTITPSGTVPAAK